jgi:hypothetical protein
MTSTDFDEANDRPEKIPVLKEGLDEALGMLHISGHARLSFNTRLSCVDAAQRGTTPS